MERTNRGIGWDTPIAHIYYEDSLSARKIQGNQKKVIRYHPFGIGIGTGIVFGVSVQSADGSTEIPKYRISFSISSSGSYTLDATDAHQNV